MKRLLVILAFVLGLTAAVHAQAPQIPQTDEQMMNAQLRFIMEHASLSKKEYQKFAKIYVEHNEALAKLNRELKPDNPEYMKRWKEVNDDYEGKLEKALPDSTRAKIGVAQFELGQKIWKQWDERSRRGMEMQIQMWQRWAENNRQIMMQQPQMMEFQHRHEVDMQRMSEQQQQWWENYWRNWERPDSSFFRRFQRENEGRWPGSGFAPGNSLWQQGGGNQGSPAWPQGNPGAAPRPQGNGNPGNWPGTGSPQTPAWGVK